MTPILQRTVPVSAVKPRQPKRPLRRLGIGMVVVAFIILMFRFGTGSASVTHNAIHSGLSGECLDVLHSGRVNGTPVDIAPCNATPAQNWLTTATVIKQQNTNFCLTANPNESIVLDACSSASMQVWLRDQKGYFNPDTGKCLGATVSGQQLRLTDCGNVSSAGEIWSPDAGAQEPPCSGPEGVVVACNAVKQWSAWQNSRDREALLNVYTDGTPYEEWCADFISYIYKQSGYPFVNGSADGWDENDANAMQYMGFTTHTVEGGYIPKPGDVAFFDYAGGHVELVVSGGSKPTFVYGDSAEVDPTTGNGQMKANTVTQDDTLGQVVYYLSPTGS